MKKRSFGLVLAMMLSVSTLAGCGAKASESVGDAGTASATESTTEEVVVENEPCEITYLTWSQSADGLYPQNMVDSFMEKYPWITVNCEIGSQSQEEYVQAQKVRFLAGEDIDVTTLYPNTYNEFIEAGYLEDLSGQNYLSNYTDSSIEAVTVDGKVYAIPFAMDAVGIMYNKDMFAEHGWETPKNVTEWKELCSKISAEGITPMVNGAKDAWPLAHEIYPFMQRLYLDNPTIFEEVNAGTVKYTDEAFIKTFTEIDNYFQSDAVSREAIGMTFDQANAYFASGKAAMVCHGEWAQGSIEDAEPAFSIGVFQLPYNNEGEEQIGASEVGQFQAMSTSTKNKEAAQLFIDFMSSEEAASLFAASLGNFPAVAGVSKPGMEEWQPLLDSKTIPFYYDQMYTGASSELFKQLQLLYTGDTTVEKALSDIQAVQDKKEQ